MSWTKVDFKALRDSLTSHCLASGVFDRVDQHEPKKAPGTGVTAAIYLLKIRPYPAGSGMRATTGVVTMAIRSYLSMLQEPQDDIDAVLFEASNEVMLRLSGDFTLDGLIRNIDLMGASQESLEAEMGYVTIDGKMQRISLVTVPCIVNDLWSQAE